MRCGYHCTKDDFFKMKNDSDIFLNLLKKGNPTYMKYGQALGDEMKDYDFTLASNFLLVLNKDISLQEKYEKEEKIIEELLQNIMVDIYEHN